MCMEKITSTANQLIKDTKKLITSSKERYSKRLFVLEGARLCFDVLNSVYSVKYFFITEDSFERYGESAGAMCTHAERSFIISGEVAKKLSDTQNSQGVFAVCEMKSGKECDGKKLIALDNVQDPANLGAIIRTAEALGIDGIIAFNCCDVFNSKVLRASMGGVLRLSFQETESLKDELEKRKSRGYRVYSTVPDAAAQSIVNTDFDGRVICVIGNEANGVSEEVKSVSDSLITIPMLGRAESLNASVAASITMWEMLR